MPPRVDVVVVGAGLAGLCTAYQCHSDGASVAIIEAGEVGRRTTGHSTAKITALHGLIYDRLRRGKDLETAARYAAGNVDAVLRLRELIARLSIDCDFTPAAAFTCAATQAGVADIEAEVDAASAAGLPVELVTETDLPFGIECAVKLADQAHFNPYAFCAGLAEELWSAGVHIIEHTRVTAIDEDKHDCSIVGDGFAFDRLACDVAVQTTHLPVVDPAFIAARVRPERSYALAAPLPAAPQGMYLAPDAGWSIRPWHRDGESMVIVGGQGHSMLSEVASPQRYQKLEAWARSNLGVTPVQRWSAFDYAPADGVPLIGRLSSRSRRRYVATGFQKWGMSTSMLAAVIISDAIAGRDNPYADVFDSTRIVPTLTRNLAKSTGQVAGRWLGAGW